MVLPLVVGFKLTGKMKTGVTATDLVLTVTQMLRKHGVVGKFVEFYGELWSVIFSFRLRSTCFCSRCYPQEMLERGIPHQDMFMV